MGKGVEDGAIDKACTECSRVCQTTHGKGLPHSVPKFFKAISEYSTPSSSSCNLVSFIASLPSSCLSVTKLCEGFS